MKYLKRILLIPCLSPLLLVLVISALNISKPVELRILTWRTGKLSIGGWMALASSSSAIISGLSVILLVDSNYNFRRRVHIPANKNSKGEDHEKDYMHDSFQEEINYEYIQNTQPERNPKDPFPTVTVPYRIIELGEDNIKEDLNDYDNMNDITYTNSRYEENDYETEEVYNDLVEEEKLDSSQINEYSANNIASEDWKIWKGEDW